jgi:2-succinyl-6-hydroxy-2,4-cyclohexadiene-1-carboxylate synthase
VENWRDHMEFLAGHFRVIAVDLPGHGRTDAHVAADRYTMERVSADLAVLMQKLKAIPAHWLGYSMGGRLALYIALNSPYLVYSLILESASPGLKDAADRRERRARDEALAAYVEAEGVPAFVAAWENLPLFSSQEGLSIDARLALHEQRLANSTRGLAGSLRGMGTGAQPSLWDQLEIVDQRVLLLAGSLDEKFVGINRQMASAIPGALLQIVEDAGHAIHLEQPERFCEIVLNFLTRSSGGPQDQSQTKENDEGHRGQGHLFEPRVERRQIIRASDGQPIAEKERQGQNIEELPG